MTRRPGLSLLELLVVVSLIGVLVGLTLPAVQQTREAAARAVCLDKLRQIGIATHSFHAVHGRLPPAGSKPEAKNDPNRLLSWMAHILPHVDRATLYAEAVQACFADPDPTHSPPHIGFVTPLAAYVCPDDGRLTGTMTDSAGTTAAFTSYVGVLGSTRPDIRRRLLGSLGEEPGARFSDFADGTSQTLLAGERPPPDSADAGWWYPAAIGTGKRGPNSIMALGSLNVLPDNDCPGARYGHFGPGRLDNTCDRFHFWSLHPGGGNWLFADGSARYLPYSIRPDTLLALGSRSGGEAVALPD